MAKFEKLASDPVYSESLQHLHACYSFCSVFQGREDIVEKIHVYLDNDSKNPLILHGESGCGKTSLMAKGVSEVCRWIPSEKSVMLLLRFLGTTPNSSSITPLLISLCRQLSVLYDQPLEDIPNELAPLIQFFKKLLTLATDEKPIVLFLDSLDQLSGADGAHQLAWLPAVLPPHVKLVLSTLPNYYNLLDTLKNMIDSENNFVQVLPLGENLSGTILKFWLKNANRTLTEAQWNIVNEAFTKCNLPLFVKLVFDEVCGWKSYTKPNHTTLAYTIHDSIMKLFEKIEMQHGKTLVAHALGYITAAKSGLSEAELEDLLSLDEKVLNDVYQYHLPPVRRIPPLLWTRIRNDLPAYLSEREADAVNVIAWYHRQFINAATERYFKNLNFLSNVHSNVADYFIGVWGGGNPKPFEYTEQQRRMFHLEEKGGECDRKVPLQPLAFLNAEGEVIRHNLRKLCELPYHLIRSHRYEELYCKCLFNFNWLHAKLSSMPLQTVLSDFEDLLDHVYQKDVKLIADAIRLSSSILSNNPSMLGPQIIGRLLPHYYQNTNIQSLIQQCDTDGLLQCALVPVHHCLHTPGGPLQYSLEGHLFAPFGICVTSNGKYLISVSNRLIIWDLSTGEVFRTIEPSSEGILQGLTLSDNDKYAVCYTTTSQVLVFSIMTGECITVSPPIASKSFSVIGSTISNTNLAIWTKMEWYLFTLNGTFISSHDIELKMPIVNVEFGGDNMTYLTVKSGMDSDNEMTLEVQDQSIEPFEFHSAIALSRDKQKMYTCIEISDFAVVVYVKDNAGWHYDRTLGDNNDEVFALTLSKDENYLVATIATGYKLWNLKTDNRIDLTLPSGTRNIPSRNQVTSPLVFTKHNHFVVAGVRKNLYVWDVKQGNMVKTLDAHFGRIIALTAVTEGGNKVISSSIDKTIKVWNFDNILEDVHSIDRLEKPIEDMQIASEAEVAVTTSRNCVGVWNLLTGKLQKTFGTSSIVTLAVITKNADFIAAAETANIAIWDLKKEALSTTIPQKDIQQLILNDDDTKVIALSKLDQNKGFCACYALPSGQQIYKFEFGLMRKFKQAVVTRDGSFLAIPALDKSGDVLGVYHARNGTHLYNLQLKYNNYKELVHLVYMPHDPNQIAVVDEEKSNVLDLKKRTLVRSVNRWNGMCTKDGKTGLYAPNRGGLQLLDTKSGKTKMTMIPRVAEGVFTIDVMFTQNNQHVVYYHSGHRTIRVFRVKDGKRIANFKAHAEVKVISCTPDGSRVVIGAVDGSVTILAIADPVYEDSVLFLQSFPSRQLQNMPRGSAYVAANGDLVHDKHSIGTTLQVARFVAKARGAQKSGACLVS
ncbi:hypothetical protein ScPMuIL_015763 [Solemya velum]